MLGPNGDFNGCVSIRDYERFLAAFERGEIKRLVVVSNVADLARQPLKPICLMTGAPIRANLAKAATGHRAKSRPISFPGETIMATTGPTAAIEVAAIEDTSLLAFYRDMNAAERHTFRACASYGR